MGVSVYGSTLANDLISRIIFLSNVTRKQKEARHPLFKGMELSMLLPRVMAL